MSCENCERSQDTGQGYYIRIGASNVYVQACEEHFKELQTMVKACTEQPETNVDTTEERCSEEEEINATRKIDALEGFLQNAIISKCGDKL